MVTDQRDQVRVSLDKYSDFEYSCTQNVMLTTLLRSRTLRQVLGLFFTHPTEEFYARDIARRTAEPMGALQRQLVALKKGGLLQSRRVGPLKYYYLNGKYSYLREIQSMILKDIRKKNLEKSLRSVLQILKKRYGPDKVILYGSFAKGQISETSDLDLLIIKKDVPVRYWDRIKELAPLLCESDVGLDYVVWTPEEWHKGLQENQFLAQEIVREGKVVYDKTA